MNDDSPPPGSPPERVWEWAVKYAWEAGDLLRRRIGALGADAAFRLGLVFARGLVGLEPLDPRGPFPV